MVNNITLNNVGKLFITDSMQRGVGIINARSFLNEVLRNFAKNCASYYNFVGEMPFIYKELQLHSVLLPAIAKNSDACMVEQPIKKEFGDGKSSGRVDYWVLYGSTVFLIELKHGWISGKSKILREDTLKKWEEAVNQIKSITNDEVRNLCSENLNVVKIALMVCPVFFEGTNKDKLNEVELEDTDFIKNLFTDECDNSRIKTMPNYIAQWKLHESLTEIFEYESNNGRYTDVGVVGLVENLGYVKDLYND